MSTNEVLEVLKKKLTQAQNRGDTKNARKWARLIDALLRGE